MGCHTSTGITAYLEAGFTLDNAQAMASHESPCTTKLYDRPGRTDRDLRAVLSSSLTGVSARFIRADAYPRRHRDGEAYRQFR